MVAYTDKPIPMTPFTDAIPDDSPSNYEEPSPVQASAKKAASASTTPFKSLAAVDFSPRRLWNKISDGVSNNKRTIIIAVAIAAFATLTHFVGLIGALAIGAICLVLTSRVRF